MQGVKEIRRSESATGFGAVRSQGSVLGEIKAGWLEYPSKG